jgi:D-alanyl-D-alanine-carboxypeptidase/D-alanyl-D-alanine-endopeptidase
VPVGIDIPIRAPNRGGVGRLLPCLLLALTASASHARSDESNASEPAPNPTPDEVRGWMANRVEAQHRGTGAFIEVITSSGRNFFVYGTRAGGASKPFTDRTVVPIQSLTKVFTALLLADMVRQGQVSLDEPVEQILGGKGVHLPEIDEHSMSLVDLGTHTAGLPLKPTNLVATDPENKYDGYTPEMLIRFLSEYRPLHAPGTHYEYSNVGFGVLGLALSTVSGQSYGQMIRERITRPLGLRDTRLELGPAPARGGVVGYTTDGDKVSDHERGALDAAGALHSSASDLSTLIEVALGYRAAPRLSRDIAITLETRRPGGQSPSDTALSTTAIGWNVLDTDAGGIVFKNGFGAGFRIFMGYNKQRGMGVVGFINVESDIGVDDIALRMLGMRIAVDVHIPKKHTEVAINPQLLDRYVGRYRFSETDILTVTRDGDHLYCQPEGQPKIELHPESAVDFFLKEVDVQVTFEGAGESASVGPASTVIWHQGGQDERGARLP